MLKIIYLLESTCLCGGVKVVFRQAEALIRRGHRVTIICSEDYPGWFYGRVPYMKQDPFDSRAADDADWILGTTPRLILAHSARPDVSSRLVHLIQGYEPDIRECEAYLSVIHQAYSLSIPKITVSGSMARTFDCRYPGHRFVSVGQGLETDYFYPAAGFSLPLPQVDRLFLVGPLSISFKQLRTGLTACSRVRQYYPDMKLIRISPVDTREEEEALIGRIDEYHVQVPPEEVGHMLRSGSGILLSSSDHGEGFGLPAVEAMACGVPAALTDILSYRTFSDPCDYAEFAPSGNPDALAEAVCVLISDPVKREHHIKRGLEVAAQFSYGRVAEAIEGVLYRA